MSRVTAVAPSTVALIHSWGAADDGTGVAPAPCLSMTLDRCVSHCTAETIEAPADEVFLVVGDEVEPADEELVAGVVRHLDRLRCACGSPSRFRVETFDTLPSGAGIGPSPSGFAALALATTRALDRRAEPEELSALARLSGSGSAALSVFGGYVERPGDSADPDSPARQLAPAGHWALCDVVAVVDSRAREPNSREEHGRAPSSPHFERHFELLPGRLERARRAVLERDFAALAEVVEEDAVGLHLVAMSSRPPSFHWTPETLAVMDAVRFLRRRGVDCCFTIDAGPNVHVICPFETEEEVAGVLSRVGAVERVIRDRVGSGPTVFEGE